MMESLSGIVGPTIGGLVAAHGEKRGFNHAPLAVVLATYFGLFVVVSLIYESTVMARIRELQAAGAAAKGTSSKVAEKKGL